MANNMEESQTETKAITASGNATTNSVGSPTRSDAPPEVEPARPSSTKQQFGGTLTNVPQSDIIRRNQFSKEAEEQLKHQHEAQGRQVTYQQGQKQGPLRQGDIRQLQQYAHPLDPLSVSEMSTAVSLIREHFAGFQEVGISFCRLTLKEPHKDMVLHWNTAPDDKKPHIPREALSVVLVRSKNKTYEIEVSLDPPNPHITSSKGVKGVQPQLLASEYFEVEKLIKTDPVVAEVLARRCGITDLSNLMVDLWVGFFSNPRKRIGKPLLFLKTGSDGNGYARPIDGIQIDVDLNLMKVLDIVELFDCPVPPPNPSSGWESLNEFRKGLKPIQIIQPQGVSFTVEGRKVSWQNWSFRVGFTAWEGLILHEITYNDKGKIRPIIYRASVAEMVVPYGDPRHPNYLKNAFDAGEDGLGRNANNLRLGCDCLGAIHYFDANLCDAFGNTFVIENAICLHEEDYGILWKHKDWRTGFSQTRRSRRLVVSFFTTIANYDYGFYWYFYQDGAIKFEAKLSGILSTSAIKEEDHPHGYGTIIGRNLYAPIHQHFFGVRLDMQVDGRQNSVQEVNVQATDIAHNPYRSAFYATATTFQKEKDAQRTADAKHARYWRVMGSKKNAHGEPCGYKIIPGAAAVSYAMPESTISKRAGFIRKTLWVTPYNPKERYPSGDYPMQRDTEDGLSKWTKQNRNIENTDIVVWYTVGVTHVTRSEDWPVMPVEYCGFEMKPENFFDYSPAMDVPPPPPKEESQSCCTNNDGQDKEMPKAKL